jgi:hypothetical protein
MKVRNRLATSPHRTDKTPNQELAKRIAAKGDRRSVSKLVESLKNKSNQSECIEVLYEIGELDPSIIADFRADFIELLDDDNNRMVWGAMTALDAITLEDPDAIYSALARIIAAANRGSVITRDHAVSILIKLCSIGGYSRRTFPVLLDQLRICPANQLPMYAENATPAVSDENRAVFIETLSLRLDETQKESKRRRVEKVIRKVS